MKALVSCVLLLIMVTATWAEEANEQPNSAEFGGGPLPNPRRQLPEDKGTGPSSSGGKEEKADDQNHALEPGRGRPSQKGGKNEGLPEINEVELPSLDREPFIIIKEGTTCTVLRVFDVTRDKLRFQVGRISYVSREGAENDAKSLCATTTQTPPLPPRRP